MCGISGYINLNEKPIQDSSQIISMLRLQKHRGPDDSGIRAFSLKTGRSVELNSDVPRTLESGFEGVLGFNRLSILDLSQNGHQPMISPDQKVLLSLNGEIYNAFDLKPELEKDGYRFKSSTDTEVVLALYLKEGFEGMLGRLNGMFSVVVVDLGHKQVFIGRDRFGIKPMYYINSGELFAFSSELKSFSCLENFRFRLKEDQLDEFLLFRNNLRGTLFQGIESLEPGHFLSYEHGKLPVKKRYFNLDDYSRTEVTSGTLDDFGEKLEGWLGKSVQNQLMSDVKLGCQLSGGIDSTLVTWLANRNSAQGSFESVSIIFNNQQFSEEKYIDRVTETLGITSHKFLLDSSFYLDHIEKATWHLEAPLNHPNTVGIYKLSQQAKEYVTVLLSGEGADEVFGGYSRFYDIGFPFRTRKIISEIRRNRKNLLALLDYMNPDYRAVMATAYMSTQQASKLRSGFSMERAMAERKALYHAQSGSLFDRQVKYEMHSYLPDLLIRQDKMSMAHSIENRVPFLDNEVVEKAFTIPEKHLLLRRSPEGTNNEKYLMKKMTADTFGDDFAFRDKMGFGIPIREFFLDQEFATYLNDKIAPGIMRRGLFNHQLVSSWLLEVRNIGYRELEALWVIVAFEIWASLYLDN